MMNGDISTLLDPQYQCAFFHAFTNGHYEVDAQRDFNAPAEQFVRQFPIRLHPSALPKAMIRHLHAHQLLSKRGELAPATS